MKLRSGGPRRGISKAVLGFAAVATAAVVIPASPAAADTSVGWFTTLSAGTSMGLEIEGIAVLTRTSSSTIARVVVWGLEPGELYTAHLHNMPCSAANPGGGHYQNVPGAGATPPNELWLSSTSDPTDGITANGGGVGVGRGRAPWVARPEAQSIVVHFVGPTGTTAGGPKVACADL